MVIRVGANVGPTWILCRIGSIRLTYPLYTLHSPLYSFTLVLHILATHPMFATHNVNL